LLLLIFITPLSNRGAIQAFANAKRLITMSKMSRTIDQPIIDLATFDLEEFLSEFDLLTDTDGIDEATDVTDTTLDESVVTTG